MADATAEQAPAAPSGTLTFLFTDIEGSTQRWERDRAAMQAAVRLHDDLVRAAIESHGGVVFKTVGDAFYAVFALAPRAAQAAVAVQTAMQTADFKDVGGLAVRIALHTGNADERGGDYFGPALNRVARLLSTGHGGQTLLSAVTAGLVDGQLPLGTVLDDLGMHRLKDLERPEHVHQLSAQESRREFPALRSLDATPNNLPLQVTSFVERNHDIGEITALLEEHRVVTLVGSGGVGKTRISLQIGANLIEHYEDGVWFIELAPVSEPSLLANAVASALGLTIATSSDPVAALVATLKTKRLLLILDNCEHLVNAAAEIASAIIRGCPKVAILSSSRQALGIGGEASYRIPSLPTPDAERAATMMASDVPKYAALSLFAARAQSADSRFKVTDDNVATIAEICRRLDGIALAIELAAPRIKMLSLPDLRDRLNERFRVLTGGSRDALPRQQTLRATVDWSFDLLSDAERRLFSGCGIFADGFTLEAATCVCFDDGVDEFQVLELLSSLVDKSLVIAEVDGDSSRYRLLETTRAYAREKLADTGDLDRLAERHLSYFTQQFRIAREKIASISPQFNVQMQPEFENARAAVAWSLRSGRFADGAEIFTATSLFRGLGQYSESKALAAQFLASLPEGEHRLRARLLLRSDEGLPEQLGRRALAEARLSGDPATLVLTMIWSASDLIEENRLEEAEALAQEAESIVGGLRGERLRIFSAWQGIAQARGDWTAALRVSEEQHRICRETGLIEGMGWTLKESAEIERERGNLDRAMHLTRDALAFAEVTSYGGPLKALLFELLARLAIDRGDLAGARTFALTAIPARAKHLGQGEAWASISSALESIAFARALEGVWSSVAVLAGYAEAHPETHMDDPMPSKQRAHKRFTALMQEHYAADELAAQLAAGAGLSRREAISLAVEAAAPEHT